MGTADLDSNESLEIGELLSNIDLPPAVRRSPTAQFVSLGDDVSYQPLFPGESASERFVSVRPFSVSKSGDSLVDPSTDSCSFWHFARLDC